MRLKCSNTLDPLCFIAAVCLSSLTFDQAFAGCDSAKNASSVQDAKNVQDGKSANDSQSARAMSVCVPDEQAPEEQASDQKTPDQKTPLKNAQSKNAQSKSAPSLDSHSSKSKKKSSQKAKKVSHSNPLKSSNRSDLQSKISKIRTPREHTSEKVTQILRELKGRPVSGRGQSQFSVGAKSDPLEAVSVPLISSKQDWLNSVYQLRLVDSSPATGLLADKLLFFEVASRELGEKSQQYLVHTVGLRDFLVRYDLVDHEGRLVRDGDRIESALFQEFPSGFVARPAIGVAPRETGHGLFADTDQLVQELLRADSFLYQSGHRLKPVRSTVLNEIASGEGIVLQEDLIATAAAQASIQSPLKNKNWHEVRVHTYEGRVIEDATPNFWVRDGQVSSDQRVRAQKFVKDFLDLLPQTLISRQAWSFDVLVLDNGFTKIVDLVTNRGRKIAWSTYLDQPRVLGAYSRHFEQYAGVRFAGMGGLLLRNNIGNYFGYWGIRIEKSHSAVDKMLAWIPPLP